MSRPSEKRGTEPTQPTGARSARTATRRRAGLRPWPCGAVSAGWSVVAARSAEAVVSRSWSWIGMSTRVAQGELTELPVLLSVVCYTQPVHSGCFSMGLTWSVRATRPRSQRGASRFGYTHC